MGKKGMEALQFGCLSDALPALQSCYQIRVKAMYAHHREVTEVADQLARCYAMMGSFSESAQYLKVCLPDIQDSSKRISLYEEKILEAKTCLEKAAQIFELHYGKWNDTYLEILQRLDKVRYLVDNAKLKPI